MALYVLIIVDCDAVRLVNNRYRYLYRYFAVLVSVSPILLYGSMGRVIADTFSAFFWPICNTDTIQSPEDEIQIFI